MSVSLTINGNSYAYPEVSDVAWGADATDWAVAVTNGMLQKAGGLFLLLADVNFGSSFGLVSLYYKSRTANISTAGVLRLARADTISFRNEANDGNLPLGVNSDDELTFNGSAIGNFVSVADTATIDLTLTAGELTADIVPDSITNSLINASAAIAYSKLNLTGGIVNADVHASAAIAVSKLAALTASRAVVSDGSGFLAAATTTATEIGYVNGVTSAIQTQLNSKQASGNYITALTGDVTASGPGSVAATIGVNKVLDTMIRQSAALSVIGRSANSTGDVADIAAATDGNVLRRSGTSIGFGSLDLTAVGTVGSSVLGIANGGTGQATKAAAFDALSPMTTGGDLIYGGASGTGTRLANGSVGDVLTSAGGTSAPVWSAPASAPSASYDATNLSLAASVGSSALTVALKTQAGSDPSGGSPVKIGFRNSTAATGTYEQRSVTGALSVVVSSGSTLGTQSGIQKDLFVYAIDNAGTVELAISAWMFDDGSLVSTTAEGGAGAADSGSVMYSTTARSNVPCRLIGRLRQTQATAGTWASAPTEIATTFLKQDLVAFSGYRSGNQTGVNPNNSSVKVNINSIAASNGSGFDTNSLFDPTTNFRWTAPYDCFIEASGTIEVAGTNVVAARYAAAIGINGTAVAFGANIRPTGAQQFSVSIAKTLKITAAQTVELMLFGNGDNSASTLTINGGVGVTYFDIRIIK